MRKFSLQISNIAAYGLFFLFPGFYIYNILLATGNIPAISGGYFAFISVFLFVIFASLLGKTFFRSRYAQLFSGIFVGLICWCLLLAIVSLINSNASYSQQAFIQVIETIVLWVVFFHLGLYVNLNQSLLRLLFWLSGLLILINIIYYVVTTGSVFYYVKEFYDASDKVTVYQGLSRSALVTAFICLATVEFKGFRLLLLIIAAFFCLFVLGSRSELVAFVSIISVIYVVGIFRNPSRIIIPMLGLVIILMASFSFYNGFSNSRQMELFNLDESSSWQARSTLSAQAIGRILQSPVIGEVGGHFESGGRGGYAHNILSAWDSFGFIGFLLYFLLILLPTIDAVLLLINKKSLSANEKFFIFMAISSFLLSLAAKSIYSPLPAIAWGLYVSNRALRRAEGTNVRR